MSRSRHVEIALTYTRPFLLRIWAALAAAFVIWVMCLRDANYQERCSVLMLGASLAGWIGPTIVAHAKEQLADARARLTPKYVAPHLLIAALAFIVTVAGMTWLTVARLHQLPEVLGWPSVAVTVSGLLAVVMLAATALSLMSHTQSPALVVLVIVAVGFSISLLRGMYQRVIAGDFPGVAIAIIAICAATLAGLWWRLGVMREEMFEFWRTESFNSVRTRVMMTGDRFYRRAAAGETGWLTEYLRAADRLDRLGSVFAAPFWERVAHWRMAIGHGRATWVVAAPIAACFFTLHAFFCDGSKNSEQGLLIVMPTVISLTGTIMATGLIWPNRWFMLPLESLRPAASRATFFREQGLAMAIEMASLWVWFTIGAFAPALVLRPQLILTSQMASVLVLLAASQVWLFGASVWLLRLRLSWFINFLAIILIVAGVGHVVAIQAGDDLRTPSPYAAPVVFIAGILAAADGYRRWLKTDLD